MWSGVVGNPCLQGRAPGTAGGPGTQQEIERLNTEAKRSDKKAQQQERQLEQQQKRETRAQEPTQNNAQRKAQQQPQVEQVGSPAKQQTKEASKHERKQTPPAGRQVSSEPDKARRKAKAKESRNTKCENS